MNSATIVQKLWNYCNVLKATPTFIQFILPKLVR